MAENRNIEVGGRLHSIATGNVIAGANEIFDDDKNKKQSDINTETYSLVNDVNERLSGLSPDQQSALSVAAKATNNETKLGYYVCDTEGNLAAKVISNATGYVLSPGGSMKVKMTNANTAADATLNINSTGAKPLFYDGVRASVNNTWDANEVLEIYYDGTNYQAYNIAGGSGDGVFDVSKKYPTSGVEGGNTYTLEGALYVLNTNLPASKKKGGMSIKFVQSSDNKYVQYRYMGTATTGTPNPFLDETNWSFCRDDVYVDNPEYINVKTDSDGRILWAIRADGTIYWGAGVPQQVIDYVQKKIDDLSLDEYEDIVAFLNGLEEGDKTLQDLLDERGLFTDNPEYLSVLTDSESKVLEGVTTEGVKEINIPTSFSGNTLDSIDNPEYLYAITDNNDRILAGIKKDGSIDWSVGVPQPIQDFVASYVEEKIAEQNHLTDEEMVKMRDLILTYYTIEDIENRKQILTDSEGKVISYRDEDGKLVENVGIQLPESALADFNAMLNGDGHTGDWSEYISNDGDKPLHLPIPRCAVVNITNDGNNAIWPTSKEGLGTYNPGVNADLPYYMEYWDMEGNYFKKKIICSAQGNSSIGMPKRNLGFDMFDSEWDGDAFKIKFGNWVPQDSFHLKAYYLDLFRCVCPISYKLARQMAKTLNPLENTFWKKEMLPVIGTGTSDMSAVTDYNLIYDNGALAIPDGFPCIVYLNGEFYGVYAFQLKKHRDNYMMKKGKAGHVHLDGCIKDIFGYNGTVDWSVVAGTTPDSMNNSEGFEIRNPKDLVYAEVHQDWSGANTYKYDADATGQYEIAGHNDGSSYPTWETGSYDIGDIVEHNGHKYMNTVAGNTNEPVYDKKKNGDDAPDFKNKTGCGWLNVTNSIKVKESVIALSTYVPELAQMVSDGATDTEIKAKIEQHFDVAGLIDYILLSVSTGYETGGKNWQWITYDGIKWSVAPWDFDGAFGWNGWGEVSPTAGITSYTTGLDTPSGWIYSYYIAEIKQRYADLRNKNVLSPENLFDMFDNWLDAIGADNYARDMEKWPCDHDHYSSLVGTHYDNKYRLYNWIVARINKLDTVFEYSNN